MLCLQNFKKIYLIFYKILLLFMYFNMLKLIFSIKKFFFLKPIIDINNYYYYEKIFIKFYKFLEIYKACFGNEECTIIRGID